MLPSRVGSPSHSKMTKLHIHRGAGTPSPHHTYTSPSTQLWETLNDEVRNFEVESQKIHTSKYF